MLSHRLPRVDLRGKPGVQLVSGRVRMCASDDHI